MNESFFKKTVLKHARQDSEQTSAVDAFKLDYALVFVIFGEFLMSNV